MYIFKKNIFRLWFRQQVTSFKNVSSVSGPGGGEPQGGAGGGAGSSPGPRWEIDLSCSRTLILTPWSRRDCYTSTDVLVQTHLGGTSGWWVMTGLVTTTRRFPTCQTVTAARRRSFALTSRQIHVIRRHRGGATRRRWPWGVSLEEWLTP